MTLVRCFCSSVIGTNGVTSVWGFSGVLLGELEDGGGTKSFSEIHPDSSSMDADEALSFGCPA